MDVVAEVGRNPVSKHPIQREYGNEQADAGRECRTRLARSNSQARTGTGKYSFPLFQLTTCRVGNLTRLIHTLICVTAIHTYIHTSLLYILYRVHCITSGCGKREAHKYWSTMIPEKVAPVFRITLKSTGLSPVDPRQRTPSVRNCVT